MSGLLSRIPEKYKKNYIYNKLRQYNYERNRKNKEKILEIIANDPRYNNYVGKIERLRNIHNNERCFILCTGPSINKTNLNLIKDEILFGVNTINKVKKNLTFEYYATADYENIWKKHKDTILEIDTILCLGGIVAQDYLNKKYDSKSEIIPFRQLKSIRDVESLEINVIKGLYTCRHVPASVCLQLTFHMGFKEVYLVGCDCDYSGPHHFYGTVNKHEMDHTKRLGYWDEVFLEYKILRDYYEKHNRKIYNSTVGGKLEVFERKSLEEVI